MTVLLCISPSLLPIISSHLLYPTWLAGIIQSLMPYLTLIFNVCIVQPLVHPQEQHQFHHPHWTSLV